jgi:hypothetical protein
MTPNLVVPAAAQTQENTLMNAKKPAVRLREAAVEALAARKTPAKALNFFNITLNKTPGLRDALCLEYLERVASETRASTSLSPNMAVPEAAAGQSERDTQRSGVGGGTPDKATKVNAHKRRTPGQATAARNAMLMGANAIYESLRVGSNAIGDLTYREIVSLIRDYATDAASFLRLGTEATAFALLLDKIAKHGVPIDQEMKVREIISATLLEQFHTESLTEAPRFVERGMRQYAKGLQDRSKEIDGTAGHAA